MHKMTREEAIERLRTILSHHPVWTSARIDREVKVIRRAKKGERLLVEVTYMGHPQGIVRGREWEEKSFSSSRVVPIGELID